MILKVSLLIKSLRVFGPLAFFENKVRLKWITQKTLSISGGTDSIQTSKSLHLFTRLAREWAMALIFYILKTRPMNNIFDVVRPTMSTSTGRGYITKSMDKNTYKWLNSLYKIMIKGAGASFSFSFSFFFFPLPGLPSPSSLYPFFFYSISPPHPSWAHMGFF